MYFFIAIVFIAELIISGAIICSIYKLDKQVVVLSSSVEQFRPNFRNMLVNIRKGVAQIVSAVKDICIFIEKQREKYIIKLIQNVLSILLLFLLRGKSKRYMSAVELALSLGKIL